MADRNNNSALLRLWRQLTEPDASIQEPEQRHQAQFLATVFLILGPLGILGVILPGLTRGELLLDQSSFYVYVLASLVAAIAYFMSRTRWYKVASWIAIVVSSLAIFLSTFADPTPGIIPGLFYLIIPVMLGGMLLSVRSVIIMIAFQIIGLLALPIVLPYITWGENVSYPFAFTLIASVMIVLVAHHRNLAEQDRQAALEARIAERTRQLTSVNAILKQQIAEREQAEKALAEESNLLRTLVNILPDDIYVKDPQSRFVLVNSAWARNNAGTEQVEQVIGKNDHDFFAQDLADGFWADEKQLMATGKPLIDKEEINLRLGEEQRWVQSTKVPLRDNAGNIIGLVGISRNITQRKQMEESLQSAHAELERRVVERTEELSQANATLERQIRERLQIEEQLWYQANLLQNVSDAIIATDRELKITSWNTAAERIYGWSAAEAVGRVINTLLNPIFPHDVPQGVHEQLAKNGYWRGEVTHTRKDGSHVHILSSLSQLRDSSGTAVGAVGVHRDITEHKLAEIAEREQRLLAEALRDSGAAINSTLDLGEVLDQILVQVERVVPYESANVMLIEDDVARVVQCRGYAQRAFKMEDILALRFSIAETENLRLMCETGQPFLVSDTQRYAHWQHLEQTSWIRSYIGAPIRIEGRVIGFVNLDNGRAGAFDQIHAEKLQAFANQAGIAIQNARLYDAARDYAGELEQRVAERTAQLERQRAQLQTILDAMSDGVVGIMFDAAMKPQARLMNRALTRLIGYTPDEWDFNLLRSLNTTDEEFAEVVASYGRAIEKVGFWQAKLKVCRKDGSEFDADLTVKRVNDADENMIGIVIVIRDISQEKMLQEQRSRFVANASHELRTPITNLLTRLYLMRKQPERLSDHLEIMENVAGRMRSLVEDLLEHSRFERGVIPLQRQEVDLRGVVLDVIRLQEPEADRKRIHVTYQLPDSPLIVLVDPGRMVQVFTNLVTNAINYTTEGGWVNIVCLVEGDDSQASSAAVVHVQDSGVGIAPDLLPNIFRPFYRGNEHTNGTGLGLSIAKEIVEMHGGTIAVESQVGGGTHFTVRLALVHPDL